MERLPSGDITVLFIATRWRANSHKWVLNDDGLVDYDGELITPAELLDRYMEKYFMFDIVSANICKRTSNPEGPRPYRWVEVVKLI